MGGLNSAWKSVKNFTHKTTGVRKWRDLNPLASLDNAQRALQGWGSVFVPGTDVNIPDPVAAPELVSMQQTDSDGGSDVNRRRRGSSYATSGGALGDSTFSTSGVRTKLG